ncbi:protein LSM14 homolog B isoform X1 [Microplitis demolitor]|uniref:protein LSM14 homolog B isoform X1 n=1 Tax=Microplitis demolitor TaxID=69319 RepID=UPI0004CD082F|nr:protein LSM14 homolog B isoform X1 [Microplitis demolitor]
MSSGMPELGSKISLISKADIRYEGRLFTVDPQECTIALANVRSFGTEDRDTKFPVAPQNQIYEYILFRGSDIKDIRVINNVNTIPNDPAIVQMTVQPTMNQQSYQPQPGYGHPMMGQMPPMGGQYGPPYGMAMGAMGPVMTMPPVRDPRGTMNKPPSELTSGPIDSNVINIPNTLPTANVKPLTKDQSLEDGVMDLISGSRSTTPTSSLLTRKSPTMDQGTQVGQQQQQKQSVGKAVEKPTNRTVHSQQHRERDTQNRARTGSGMSHYSDGKRDVVTHDNQMHNQRHSRGSHGSQGSHGPQGGRGSRGGWIPRGNVSRGRGRGRGGAFPQNQAGNAGGKPKNTLKFDNDYDFEQANTEFEELRSRLAKTKIDVGTENEKKDDSGNETGAGEGEPEEETDVVHYDKAKSFFDNISCEAVERSKGRSQRTDWRTERKLNSETFGVSSTRRGGFRGRGYYNRGMGGGTYRNNNTGPGGPLGGANVGSGGYRGNYRGNRGNNSANRNKRGQNHGSNSNGGQNGPINNQSTSQNRLVTGTA